MRWDESGSKSRICYSAPVGFCLWLIFWVTCSSLVKLKELSLSSRGCMRIKSSNSCHPKVCHCSPPDYISHLPLYDFFFSHTHAPGTNIRNVTAPFPVFSLVVSLCLKWSIPLAFWPTWPGTQRKYNMISTLHFRERE